MADPLSKQKLENTVGRRYDLFSGGYQPPKVGVGEVVAKILGGRPPVDSEEEVRRRWGNLPEWFKRDKYGNDYGRYASEQRG